VILEGDTALRLVFLNACAGARADERDAFQGTAQHLVRQGVPVVVAMQFDIVSSRAAALAQEFYRAVADGYPVEAALTEARKALFTADGAPDWATPVIFTRAATIAWWRRRRSSPELADNQRRPHRACPSSQR
jgi:CHAT domain-containing protein